ncbi:MAG: T9SS type A sorting domain-containing protein, partial [Crocinitomicaceae bacterium]
WERGIPNPTTNTVPNLDAPFDCGKYAFVTGNDPGLNPINDDVHNGYTKLISPQMDLTSFSNPHINFARAFYCYFGPGFVDDTLKILLSNGTQEIVIDEIGGPVNQMNFEYKSIPVNGFLPINSTMQLSIYISDFTPNNNVTEAIFDHFRVTDYNTNSVQEITSKIIHFFPNPGSQEITVTGLIKDKTISIFDLNGNCVFSKIIENESETIDISLFKQGIYFLNHNLITSKLVKN